MKKVLLATHRKCLGVLGYLPIVFLFLFISACFASSLLADQSNVSKPAKEEVIQKTQKLQVPFIANDGQTDERVKFYAKTFGGMVFVTKDGEIVYSLPEGRGRDVPDGASQQDAGEQRGGGARERGRVVSGWHGQAPHVRAESELAVHGYLPLFRADNAKCPPDRIFAKALLAAYLPGLQKETTQRVVSTLSMPPHSNPGALPTKYNPHSKIQNPQSPMRSVALKEQLVGGKINEIKGSVQSVTTVSYFKGNDPSKWKSNILTYEVVDMGEVYKGIGLRLKAYGNNVEKLFTVTSDANPDAIKLGLSGAKALSVNEAGQLVAETEFGPVKFTKPVAYQEIDGKRVEMECTYTISEFRNQQIPQSAIHNPKLEYGFTVASYDRTKDLIIDPLLASTFLGGFSWDYGESLTLDTSGNVYVTGWTASTDFPTTPGAYQTSHAEEYGQDVFVSRLSGDLTRLLASTYLGGYRSDEGISIAIDAGGNVYVTGFTGSKDFPTTPGAYRASYKEKSGWDVFVSRLSGDLTTLIASTYLGGGVSETGLSVAIDMGGNVYVTGKTYSPDFPTTGAYQTSYKGDGDVFVSRLSGDLTTLLASTYLGGKITDWAYSVAIDVDGNLYVTGFTGSTDFPTTPGAYQTSLRGTQDVFVSRLSGDLTTLLASTYLGGGRDWGQSVAIDAGGNVYVTGFTYSPDFPTTPGAYQTAFKGDGYVAEVFVSRLSGDLTKLIASTYLGGSDQDRGQSVAVDVDRNIYVAGWSASTDFPTTPGAYQTSYKGGTYYGGDVFVSRLSGDLSKLIASTYLGGGAQDMGSSAAIDAGGNVYVAGWANSRDFPATLSAYQTSLKGGYDAFVSRLDADLSAMGRYCDDNFGRPRDEHTYQGEPVNIANGNMFIIRTDISNPAPVIPFEFTRAYNNLDRGSANGPLGIGWRHNFNVTLTPPANTASPAVIRDADGRVITFAQVSHDKFQHTGDERSTLTKTASDFIWKKKEGTTYTFNAKGQLQSVKDKNSNTISLGYDDKGRLTTMIDAVGRIYTLSYDDRYHITSVKDPASGVFTYEYDDKDNLIKVTDPVGAVTLYEYNDSYDPHNITKQTVDTFIYTYSYDKQGRCITADGPNGELGYRFEYKPTEGKTVTTDSRGNILTKYYNNGGKVTRIVYPDGTEENFTWDDNFEKTAGTRRDGSTWHYEYDGNGNLTKIIAPQGSQKVMTYNVDNDLTSVVDELGNTTRYDYDGRGNLTTVTNADGTVVSFTYNTRGQPLTTTDALGKTTTFSYDSKGNLISTTDPTGNTVTYTHNALGLVTSKTNARGNTTSYEYDALNRVIKTTDPLNGQINTTHKIAGLGSLTDQNSNTTSFSYDTLNQLTDVTDPLGKIHHASYDAMGNLISRTDFNQAVTIYTYDNVDKLTKIQYPGANQAAFVYDAVGRVTQMNDYTGNTYYSYDAVGRIISYTNGQGLSVGYAYDNAGNLAALTYPRGKTVHYSYDSRGRLIQVEDWAERKTVYTYDQRGLVVDITLPNGTKAQYDYDDAGRRIGLKNLKGDDSVIASYTYTLDQNGNITTETVNQPLYPAMQPQSVNYTYSQDNRLVSVNDVSLTYDFNGNLVKKGDTNYKYDYENRIKEVVNTNGTWEYDYDGVGNRIIGLKIGGDVRRFLLDPKGATQTLAEYDGGGKLVANYVYGLGLVYKVDAADKPYYYHYNFTGSTVAMTDTNGNVVNKYAYASFGRLAGSVESVPNPFRYVGKAGVMDDKNGLFYMRARHYDPEVGRFITKDPIGFDGGVNLYGYVKNNPINYIDPQGLSMSDSFGKLVFKVITEALVKPFAKNIGKPFVKKSTENIASDAGQEYADKIAEKGMKQSLCENSHINPLTGQKYSEYSAPTPEEAERQKDIWVQIIEFWLIGSNPAY